MLARSMILAGWCALAPLTSAQHDAGPFIRCGTPEPDVLVPTNPVARGQNVSFEVGVYIHMLLPGSAATTPVTQQELAALVDILNDHFSGTDGGLSCGPGSTPDAAAMPITFTLSGVEFYENSPFWSTIENSSTRTSFALANIDTNDPLQRPLNNINIFIGDIFSLGSAVFPDWYPENDPRHNIVMNYRSIPGATGALPDFDEGDTVTHEVGHYLGLYHTFQGGCSGGGDMVADTAPQSSPTFGCPDGRNSCSGGGSDPIYNFMDYSDDCCMYKFTQGQVDRMIDQLMTYRPALIVVDDGPCVGDVNQDGALSPADFTAWLEIFGDETRTPDEIARADINNDGVVSPADFTAWLDAFGNPAPSCG